jgi:endoglucanase
MRLLWVKVPGESDGECGGGPPAGTWWHAGAVELARNAEGG